MKYTEFINYINSLNKLKRRLDYRMKKHEFNNVYIGTTSNIIKRFKKYKEMEYKQALIKVYSFKKVRYLEEKLIEYAKKKYHNCNKSDYSIGIKEGENQYYVYMVADDYKCPNE